MPADLGGHDPSGADPRPPARPTTEGVREGRGRGEGRLSHTDRSHTHTYTREKVVATSS